MTLTEAVDKYQQAQDRWYRASDESDRLKRAWEAADYELILAGQEVATAKYQLLEAANAAR